MTFAEHVLRFLGTTKFRTPSRGALAAPAEERPGSPHHPDVVRVHAANSTGPEGSNRHCAICRRKSDI
ncbi:Hypothetical protein H16_B2079 [Cupriavidus necator H16]|uniref:Uncharacterized protein n=1 Tax=Cupriavidus necator (strain ATCC 17699 / DSM 428 / KCTC 22496 / NCIMB 10442 / H16 / Stanier 337) TaxID=381666 RepID=Q0JZG3_CUPNH|nr:Hypothetical protein H16_B2079 [Cupriavidus necator H16]